MPNLFPISSEESTYDVETEENDETGYKNSVYFDFKKGDYLRTGTNRLVESSGFDAWTHWCIKCLHTQRYACLSYSTDYGIDYDAVFNSTTKEEAENELTRQINEALHADPLQRLSYIESMSFEWSNDTSVEVSLILVGIEGNTAEIQTTLNAA